MPEGNNETEYRIGTLTRFGMFAVAILVDVLQFFALFLNVMPGVGVIIGFFLAALSLVIFWLWFMSKNVPYLSGKRQVSKVLTALSTTVLELVPFISALPMTTIGVGLIIHFSRKEDDEKVATQREGLRVATEQNARLEEQRIREQQIVAANDNAAQQEDEQEAA